MIFRSKNIGLIKKSTFKLNNMTCLCGDNGIGQSEIMKELYLFFDFWNNKFKLLDYSKPKITANIIDVDLGFYMKHFNFIIDMLNMEYNVYQHSDLKSGSFQLLLEENDIPKKLNRLDKKIYNNEIITTSMNGEQLTVELRGKKCCGHVLNNSYLRDFTENIIKQLCFGQLFPRTFIVYKQIENLRSGCKWFDTSNTKRIDTDIDNIFKNIIDGHCIEANGYFFFIANGMTTKIPIWDLPRSKQPIVILYLYLKYFSKNGDMIFLDCPESGLHPDEQYLLARILSRLVNEGYRFFIKTHSYFIMQELSLLLVLRNDHLSRFAKKYGYKKKEFLCENNLSVYEINKLPEIKMSRSKVTQATGIDIETFFSAFDRLNNLQNDMLCGVF